MSDSALADLRWLSQRLKGILDMSDDIADYDSLSNQNKELSTSIDQKKSQLTSLTKSVQDLTDQQSNLTVTTGKIIADTQIQAQQSADAIVAKANVSAADIVQQAKVAAKALADQALLDQASVQDQLDKSNAQLNSIQSDVSSAQSKYNALIAQIESIKSKF